MAVKARAEVTLSCIRDLQSCTRYYLLQSSTLAKPAKPTANPPGGSWVTSEPSYTSGSTYSLYFCDLNVFTDGDYAYSDVSLSSSYEAAKAAWNKAQSAQDSVDNLEIGGRNYLKCLVNQGLTVRNCNYAYDNKTGTYTLTVTVNDGSFQQIWHTDLVTSPMDFAGKNVMVSCRDITTTDANAETRVYLYCSTTGAVKSTRIMPGENVVTIPDNVTKIGIILRCDQNANSPIGTVATFTGIKMELGDKATDWTPAPEDVEAATETAQNTADAAQAMAQQALSSTEVIVGTQTAATGAWTGNASFSALADGQTILYWLPFAGSGNATLNLTLPDGKTTGAKNVYINATARCTTHIAAGNMVQMVYRENVMIGTTAYTGWWISRALNDNTYDRIRFNNVILAKTAISASRIVVSDGLGYFHLAAGSVFSINLPILWAVSAIAAAVTGSNNFLSFPSCTLRNNAGSTWTGTQYSTVYIAGTLAGSTFTVAASNWLTTAPADESLTYISLGYMYSTYQIYLYPEHPMYRIINGALTAISQIAYEAHVEAEDARVTAVEAQTAIQRVVRIMPDGLHVGDNQNTNNEVVIDSEAVNVVTGGQMESKFTASYIQFGQYQLRRTADNGLAFKVKEG